MSVVIRHATEADAEALSVLNAEVQAIHANALPWWFKPPGEASFPPDRAAALMASPDNVVLVAELDSAPVGYAYAEIIRQPETPWRYGYEMMYLHQLGVRSMHRRRGVGRALIEAVCSTTGSAGIKLFALDVWTFNDDARAFFRRCGFASYNERLWMQLRKDCDDETY